MIYLKAAIYKGPKIIEVENVDIPKIIEGEALIKVSYAGICGTDIHIYNGEYRTVPPMIIGHEFSGEVIEIKSERESSFKIGYNVVARPILSCGKCYACKNGYYNVCQNLKMIGIDFPGAFAEYVKVPLDILYKIPADMSLKTAALIEPLAVAVHAVRTSNLKVGDNVVIFGAGSIGTLLGLVAKISGAGAVFITDINDFRVKKASGLGLNSVNTNKIDFLKYLNIETSGRMADIVFDAAGVSATAKIISDVTRIRGQIVIVGVFKKPPAINLFSVLFKEQNIIGTRVYMDYDYIKSLILLKKHPEIKNVITKVIPLKDIKKGIEAIRNSKDVIKVLVDLKL